MLFTFSLWKELDSSLLLVAFRFCARSLKKILAKWPSVPRRRKIYLQVSFLVTMWRYLLSTLVEIRFPQSHTCSDTFKVFYWAIFKRTLILLSFCSQYSHGIQATISECPANTKEISCSSWLLGYQDLEKGSWRTLSLVWLDIAGVW